MLKFLFIIVLLILLLVIGCKISNIKLKHVYLVLERFFIDILLRSMVENYDKRHPCRNMSKVSLEELKLSQQDLAKAQRASQNLLEQNKALINSLEEKNKEIENLVYENQELKETNEIFSNSIADLKRTIKTLSYEANQKIIKSVPPSKHSKEKTRTDDNVFYAEPDATGTILRKVSPKENKFSLFKLKLLDENVCNFSVLNNDATDMYIKNRSVSLLACQILEVAQTPKKFVTVDAGTAVRHDNNWIVMEPVKIKIV